MWCSIGNAPPPRPFAEGREREDAVRRAKTDLYIPSVPEERQDELKKLGEEGKLQYGELPAATRHVVMFNVADPNNPKNGVDEQGNRVEQGNHPLFGDVRVRQAFALSIDHAALNQGAFSGHGIAIGTPVLPQTWAHNDTVQPWPFDLDDQV